MRSYVLLGALAISAASCATSFDNGTNEKVFSYPGHSVTMTRSGCDITSVTLRSFGAAIPNTTSGTLMIAAHGTTSFAGAVICPPVVAGGQTLCTVISTAPGAPAESAGIGCGGWDSYNLT